MKSFETKWKNVKRSFVMFFSIIALLFLLEGCTKDSSPVSPATNPAWYENVDSSISQIMVTSGSPGAIVGIFENDKPLAVFAKGYSNIASLTKMKDDMKFRIASNTKTFTAITVQLLVEDNLIDLNKHLIDYLPNCGIQYAETITVRQLLNMTSGIASYNEQSQFVDVWNSNPLIPWTKEQLLNIIQTSTPDFYPGTSWHYSDSNYFLLGLIIEAATNQSSESEITNKILLPLSLNNTSFPVTPDMPDNYCSGYKLDQSNVLVESSRISPTGPWTGGAMISNIYDLGKWVKVLGTGSLLSDNMKIQCFDWKTGPNGVFYGLGVMRVLGLRGHDGLIQGFETIMLYSPEKDAAVVVMLNKGNEDQHAQPAASLCINIFRTVFPELF